MIAFLRHNLIFIKQTDLYFHSLRNTTGGGDWNAPANAIHNAEDERSSLSTKSDLIQHTQNLFDSAIFIFHSLNKWAFDFMLLFCG
jgi:hypothetical protein